MSTVVPIYDETGKFMGLWAQNRRFSPSMASLSELMGLAQPTFLVMNARPYNRFKNDGVVSVGKNVEFEDGVFLMMEGEQSPVDEVNAGASFLAMYHDGIPTLKRVKKPKKETRDSLKSPDPKSKPKSKKESNDKSPSDSNKVTSDEQSKPWWKFW